MPPPRPAASSLRSPSLAPLQPPGKSPVPSLIKMPSSPQRAFLAATPLPQPAVWSHRKATLTLSPVGLSLRPQNPSCPQSTHPNPVFPQPSPESAPPPSLPGAPHRHRGEHLCPVHVPGLPLSPGRRGRRHIGGTRAHRGGAPRGHPGQSITARLTDCDSSGRAAGGCGRRWPRPVSRSDGLAWPPV